ncbi:hypothetical protein HK100_012234 [Physocladia obscura]|uniref:Uncharacterized protein n=1 Tax=Physocladia obscura TaxID=109957 RepID=A0AAD5XG18_9FUNG|nr:hypothetical protein HK100_012234 [Physocladia obscura]
MAYKVSFDCVVEQHLRGDEQLFGETRAADSFDHLASGLTARTMAWTPPGGEVVIPQRKGPRLHQGEKLFTHNAKGLDSTRGRSCYPTTQRAWTPPGGEVVIPQRKGPGVHQEEEVVIPQHALTKKHTMNSETTKRTATKWASANDDDEDYENDARVKKSKKNQRLPKKAKNTKHQSIARQKVAKAQREKELETKKKIEKFRYMTNIHEVSIGSVSAEVAEESLLLGSPINKKSPSNNIPICNDNGLARSSKSLHSKSSVDIEPESDCPSSHETQAAQKEDIDIEIDLSQTDDEYHDGTSPFVDLVLACRELNDWWLYPTCWRVLDFRPTNSYFKLSNKQALLYPSVVFEMTQNAPKPGDLWAKIKTTPQFARAYLLVFIIAKMDSDQILMVANKYAEAGFHGVTDMVSQWEDSSDELDLFDDTQKSVKFCSIADIKAFALDGIIKKIMAALTDVSSNTGCITSSERTVDMKLFRPFFDILNSTQEGTHATKVFKEKTRFCDYLLIDSHTKSSHGKNAELGVCLNVGFHEPNTKKSNENSIASVLIARNQNLACLEEIRQNGYADEIKEKQIAMTSALIWAPERITGNYISFVGNGGWVLREFGNVEVPNNIQSLSKLGRALEFFLDWLVITKGTKLIIRSIKSQKRLSPKKNHTMTKNDILLSSPPMKV